MSYRTINEMFGSISLRDRITAAIAQRYPQVPDPIGKTNEYIWPLIARADWATAWDAADRSLTYNPDIGVRPNVITDAMILSAVEAVAAAAQQ